MTCICVWPHNYLRFGTAKTCMGSDNDNDNDHVHDHDYDRNHDKITIIEILKGKE